MSNFHLAHFSPEELKILTEASGDESVPGTNVVHLKHLEEMMKHPHAKEAILKHFHEMMRSGYHPTRDDHAHYHKHVIRKTGGHPALVGEHTGKLFNHLMGGGQPEGEHRQHYFLGKLVRGVAGAAKRVAGGVANTVGKVANTAGRVVGGVANTARKAVGTAANIAGKVSGVSNLVRKVHPGAANALDKGASMVQKGANTANGMIDKGQNMAQGAINQGQNMVNNAMGGAGAPPQPQQPPQPQPAQPAAAKRGGRLLLAHHFMRHAKGEEIQSRAEHGFGGVLRKVAGTAAKAALNATPTGRLVKTGLKVAKKAHEFSKTSMGQKVLKGAKNMVSKTPQAAAQPNSSSAAAPQNDAQQEAA